MTIINAYLGAGSGSAVPTGKCLLNIAWVPSDGSNKSGATVSAVIGSTTVTGTTDSSGNVSLLVGTGSCTVTVTPTGGSYTGKTATVTAESATEKTVVVQGQAARIVTLVMPYTLTTTAWNIKNSSNVQQTSGSGAFNDKQVSLLDGTYTLSVTAYGVTKTKSFTVSASSVRIDCTDITCLVTFNLPASLAVTMSVAGTALASNQRFVCVLRNSSALAYTGTVTTKLDGSAIATVTGANMTPSGATLTVTPTISGTRKLYTANKSLSIPVAGWYKIFLIGGGGGGCVGAKQGGGGGSGHMVFQDYYLTAGTYAITIGAGGAGGSTGANGGATSFGTIVSVEGGGGANRIGGAGGAGGGGGSSGGSSSQSCDGGRGTFGGGGGSGESSTASSYNGGSGGLFGGAGGNRRASGTDGMEIKNQSNFFSSAGSGYNGGSPGSTSDRGGGGGGGGYGAKGGNGSLGNPASGGGGGGVAGGDGGSAVYIAGTGYGGHGLGYGSGGGAGYTGTSTNNTSKAGGGGGLYNIAQSGGDGASGACQIMWIG